MPSAIERKITGTCPVIAGRGAEDARQALALAPHFGERIVDRVLIELGDAAHGHIEQYDLCFEDVAKQARDPERDIDARPIESSQRQHLDACNAAGGCVPHRLHAEIGQRLGEIISTGAQRGRGPEINHQRTRRLAVILQVAAHDLIGGARPDRGCSPCRDGARIDRGKITTCRQDIGAAAAWCPRGSGRHAPAVECSDQRGTFALATTAQRFLGASGQGEPVHRLLVRRLAEHVQAFADGEFLDVAKMRVELRNGRPVGLAAHQAAFGCQPIAPGALDDLLLEMAQAPAVEAVGGGIFLDNAFHLGQCAIRRR
jgi:hypothetical protein